MMTAQDLGVVSSPRISIGPAGCRRINRDYARRGWATETGHPNWGRVGTFMQTLQSIARQTTRAEWGATCKELEEGGDRVRTGAGAVRRGGEVGNGRVRVCRVPEWKDERGE